MALDIKTLSEVACAKERVRQQAEEFGSIIPGSLRVNHSYHDNGDSIVGFQMDSGINFGYRQIRRVYCLTKNPEEVINLIASSEYANCEGELIETKDDGHEILKAFKFSFTGFNKHTRQFETIHCLP